MELPPSIWQPIGNKTVPRKHYTNLDYPIDLQPDYVEQLIKVYSNCIHSSQYLPLLFTKNNASNLLSEKYIAEFHYTWSQYSLFDKLSISQHCRHILLKGILKLSLCNSSYFNYRK